MQTCLLYQDEPDFDPSFHGIQRKELGRGAWIEHLPGWLSGHEEVFATLVDEMKWRAQRRKMYERVVSVPRLTARVPADGLGHPVLPRLADALSARSGWCLHNIGMAYYRNGNDSVAMHGDKVGPLKDDCVIALVSVGEPRRFRLRAVGAEGSLGFQLGWGDLLVMGGTAQRTWLHGVPKVASAGPRISIQFRP